MTKDLRVTDDDLTTIRDENWETLKSLLPADWIEMGKRCGAIKRLRGFKSAEILMRVLLIHLVQGCSLRVTATIAHQANLADVSDVAILKRLKSCEPWFHKLALSLLSLNEIETLPQTDGYNIRMVDATVVREPGKTGSEWFFHYGLRVPSLACDHFELTPRKGRGTGESLTRFNVSPRDLFLADRGYCHARGIQAVASRQGDVIVRYVPTNLPIFDGGRNKINLLDCLDQMKIAGDVTEQDALILYEGNRLRIRICAVRKTEEAIHIAQKKLRRMASKKQTRLKPETLEYAKFVIILTTLDSQDMSAHTILELYRFRWQIELIFKRFKSIAGFGHLPKKDEASSKAWLYGKLFVALLAEKLARVAGSISPWGRLGLRGTNKESLAGI